MMARILQNLLGIGKMTVHDDSGDVQTMQVTEGAAGSGFFSRVTDNVKRVTEFGFHSVPPLGSEVVVLRRGGDRSNSIVIATSHRASRPKDLQAGDTALFDERGAIFKLTAAGPVLDAAGLEIVIQNASKITFDCPEVEFTGNVAVAGTLTGDTNGAAVELGALRDAYNAHGHIEVSKGTDTSGKTDHTV
ncbi:phage baseplate assembly protein V [Novosphingobium sp. 9]|uniref:phage baseplate assembly protein V n=1 Tax=Novosphingobium sp. 9 TaxID=2025349 RepID=UPI0021B6D93B|nr:phage baseplate assembly protein V [Novosphingobium sp. 9]